MNYVLIYLGGMTLIAVVASKLIIAAFNRHLQETEPDFLEDIAALEYVVKYEVEP